MVRPPRIDLGRIAVKVAAAGAFEVVIHRNDPQAGDLHIHFPRLGYDVKSM